MYEKINFEKLSELLDINLDCPDQQFDMSNWGYRPNYDGEFGNQCGTAHCLAGNLGVRYLDLWNAYDCIDTDLLCDLLGITEYEMCFLFTEHELYCRGANELLKGEALARLAKFIIYKRRKAKVWADYEAARRHEGDSCFASIEATEHDLIGVAQNVC